MKSAGELAEFLERELQVLADGREHRLRRRRVLAQAFLGGSQVHGEGDEALLGAVVQVAFESAALGDACFDDARTRSGQLIVCLGALERECDEAREVSETLLRIRTEMPGACREHEQRTPKAAACRNRCDHGGSVAGQARQPCRFAGYMRVVVDAAALVRGAVYRATGVAVGDEGSDLDAGTFAIVPAPDDDPTILVETHRASRSCLQKPARLLGDCLEHLLWLRRRRDQRRDTAERSLLLCEVNCPVACLGALKPQSAFGGVHASLHVITLARR